RWTSAAQHGAGAAARERLEVSDDRDRDVAVQVLAPDLRRLLEDDQALRAQGRSGVLSDRGLRRRIVEAGVRSVAVGDDDRCARERGGRGEEQGRAEEGP